MRDLQEYKAEILRRSEEKLRQKEERKKRMIAESVLPCLCLGLLVVAALPFHKQKGPDKVDPTTKQEESSERKELLSGSSGGVGSEESVRETGGTAGGDLQVSAAALDFEVQYIRTDGYSDAKLYPIVTVISSQEELDAYYERNQASYDLERRNDPERDYTIGFLDACDGYDSSFFEENALVLVLLEEGSGSVSHKVTEVKAQEGLLRVDVERIVPEIGSCDMAQWHIIVALKKEAVPTDSRCVQVYLDGKLAM